MVGTGALDELTTLAVSQRWRLVLVGDPRHLQAVGRGGVFDELCRSTPAYELATIHRFHHRWEQTASLRLRSGDPAALDAYLDHDRVRTGTFGDLAKRAAHRWQRADAAGHTVAVVAETNEHVDALSAAIQNLRARRGDLGPEHTRIAGTETAHVGDRVVTRRNDCTLVTDGNEPVRNRDRWTVQAVGRDGSLAVAHDRGHGTVVLPADYARSHVRLGYAATAHGNQGDTVDLGITIVTPSRSARRRPPPGAAYPQPRDTAEADLAEAKRNRWDAERTRTSAPRWRRPLLARQVADATASVDDARACYDVARADAAPALTEL